MSETLLIALIITAGTIVTSSISAYALMQANRTHHLINSRMDELLEAARNAAWAEGQQAERDRAT